MSRKLLLISSATALVGFVAGGVAGYIYANNKLVEEYDNRVNAALDEVRDSNERRTKTGKYETPETAYETFLGPRSKEEIPVGEPFAIPDIQESDLRRAVNGLRYGRDIPEDLRVVDIPASDVIELDPDSDVDWENEVASRDNEVPHILSDTEFSLGELGYQTAQLTYYAGDGVLVDNQGDQVPDIEDVVGGANLLRFGYKSNDDNIVYVRNNNLDTDFEIIQTDGRFDERFGAENTDEPVMPPRRSYPRRQDRRT